MKPRAMQRTREMADEVQQIAAAANRLRTKIGAWEMRSGAWFSRVVEDCVEHRERRQRAIELDMTDEECRRRGRRLIARACGVLAATGAGSGAAWTGATATAMQAGGLAGIVAIPLGGLVVGAEMVFRSIVHMRLVGDLTELYGIPLRPHHGDDLVRIYAVALNMIHEPEGDDLGRGIVEHVLEMDSRELGKAVGMKVFGESMVRNVLPYIGIAISSAANVRLTLRLAEATRRQVISRAALTDVFSHLERESPDSVEPLVHGMWFLLTVDGRLGTLASAVLADVVRRGPAELRRRNIDEFPDQASEWIERLAGTSRGGARALCQFALEVSAAVDGEVRPTEATLLQRAAQALGRPYDATRVEELARRVERGMPIRASGY